MNNQDIASLKIKAIIGLGNPGQKYYYNRHSIGFRVVDELAHKYGGTWQSKNNMECVDIVINNNKLLLVKPQTFMNDSGKIIPALLKQGVKAENILVVHDELEKSFGKLSFKVGGSHRGHNGLRSIIGICGPDFVRLRFGIGRPDQKDEVSQYVLHNFSEDPAEVEGLIAKAVSMIEGLFG